MHLALDDLSEGKVSVATVSRTRAFIDLLPVWIPFTKVFAIDEEIVFAWTRGSAAYFAVSISNDILHWSQTNERGIKLNSGENILFSHEGSIASVIVSLTAFCSVDNEDKNLRTFALGNELLRVLYLPFEDTKSISMIFQKSSQQRLYMIRTETALFCVEDNARYEQEPLPKWGMPLIAARNARISVWNTENYFLIGDQEPMKYSPCIFTSLSVEEQIASLIKGHF